MVLYAYTWFTVFTSRLSAFVSRIHHGLLLGFAADLVE